MKNERHKKVTSSNAVMSQRQLSQPDMENDLYTSIQAISFLRLNGMENLTE